MGYYTRFRLDWFGATDPAQEEAIKRLVLTSEGAQYCLSEDARSSEEPGKWYEWKEDLTKWSQEFPHVLFQMNGEGEETEDCWVAYAKAGQVQHSKAIITFPPCAL
jgi:hypothetical protein